MQTIIPLRRFLPALIALPYIWLVTQGDFTFFARMPLSGIYDSMARHFLELSTDIDQAELSWEEFNVNGHSTTYFGPFPGLLRIPTLIFGDDFFGMWSRISCLLAIFITLHSVWRLLGQFPKYRWILFLGFAFGSPLFFLGASSMIYHEAILWALAGSITSLCLFFEIFIFKKSHRLALFSTAIGVTLLSRGSFGFPWLIILALLALKIRKNLIPLLAPALVCLTFQMIVNTSRFGNPFVFIDPHYQVHIPKQDLDVIHTYGVMSPYRIPDFANAYFGASADNFSSQLPFFRQANRPYIFPEVMALKEPTISLTLTSIWILILAFGGITRLKKNPWVLILIGPLFLQFLGAHMIPATLQRYFGELLPFLFALSILALKNKPSKIVIIAVLFSIFSTVTSTLFWVSKDLNTPQEQQNRLSRFFSANFQRADPAGPSFSSP